MNPHPLDELSALLDGELAGDEDAAVRRHLAGCDPCRAQLSAIAEARTALRGLAALEPPVGWTDRFLRRLRRVLAVFAGAAAAVGAGALGAMWAAAPVREVTPTADVLSPPAPPAPAAMAAAPVPEAAPAGYVAPERLGGLARVEVFRTHGTLRILYSDGTRQVYLVEEDGRLDTAWVAARPGAAAGAPWPSAYRWAGGAAMTWQAGPAVMTLVGDPVAVAEAAASLPSPTRSETVVARLRRLSRDVLEDLSGSG